MNQFQCRNVYFYPHSSLDLKKEAEESTGLQGCQEEDGIKITETCHRLRKSPNVYEEVLFLGCMRASTVASLCMHVHNCVRMPPMEETKDGVRGVRVKPLRREKHSYHPVLSHTRHPSITLPHHPVSHFQFHRSRTSSLSEPKGTNAVRHHAGSRIVLALWTRLNTFRRTVLSMRRKINKINVMVLLLSVIRNLINMQRPLI